MVKFVLQKNYSILYLTHKGEQPNLFGMFNFIECHSEHDFLPSYEESHILSQ